MLGMRPRGQAREEDTGKEERKEEGKGGEERREREGAGDMGDNQSWTTRFSARSLHGAATPRGGVHLPGDMTVSLQIGLDVRLFGARGSLV